MLDLMPLQDEHERDSESLRPVRIGIVGTGNRGRGMDCLLADRSAHR